MKEYFLNVCPKSLQLPARYYYYKLRGILDDELIMLDKLVNGGRAIGIGANYGVYTYVLSKLCDQVEAFEPLPECAETIVAYSESKFSKHNINVHNFGLSNSKGSLTLYIPLINGRPVSGYAGDDKAYKTTVTVC